VFGAHFGASGTLTIGDTTVTDIERWTPSAIRFRMPAASGRVVVTTADGHSGYRDFHIGESALIETAFDRMTTYEVSAGQGINILDLGDVALDDPGFVPTGDGRYALLGDGAASELARDVTLHAGPDMHALRIIEADRSADVTRWQLAAVYGVNDGSDPRIEDIGGVLVEVAHSVIPSLVGERLDLDTVEPRLYFGGGEEHGTPDRWRNVAGGAWTISRFDANPGMPLWSLRFLTGWRQVQPFSRLPVYADAPRYTFPFQTRGLAGRGQVVLATGLDAELMGGGYQLSLDGGTTFTPHDADTPLPLREPIAVEATTPFFLVLEASYTSPGVAVHAIDLAGGLTKDVLPRLPDASLAEADTVPTSHLAHATSGGKVALRFENTHTLHLADFDAATPAWTVLTDVQSTYQPGQPGQPGTELFVVMRDGTIQRSTDWATFAPLDLGIALALPTRVVPLSIQQLYGRWLVLARLFEPASDTPSPLAPSGFLLGPKP